MQTRTPSPTVRRTSRSKESERRRDLVAAEVEKDGLSRRATWPSRAAILRRVAWPSRAAILKVSKEVLSAAPCGFPASSRPHLPPSRPTSRLAGRGRVPAASCLIGQAANHSQGCTERPASAPALLYKRFYRSPKPRHNTAQSGSLNPRARRCGASAPA